MAANAFTIPHPALVINSNATFIAVKIVPNGALRANTIGEKRAPQAGCCRDVDLGACSVRCRIPLIALFTDAHGPVKVLAVGVNLAANAIGVEKISEGALSACAFHPSLTPEVVVDEFNEGRITELISKGGQGLGRIDEGKVEGSKA